MSFGRRSGNALDGAELDDRSFRMRTFRAARVRTSTLRAENCIIRNLSRAGAKLSLTSELSLPDTFNLDNLNGGRAFMHVWCGGGSRSGDRIAYFS
jgi:hypothetical protein